MSVFGVILVRIQSECVKIRTRITPNTDTFHAVIVKTKILIQRQGNWQGSKDRLAHSVASTNLLLQKMATESTFASRVFPAEKKQKLPLQFGFGDERF